MNVLVATNMYPTPSEPWFGCFVEEQVEDLRALGLDVSVFALDGRRDRKEYGRAVPRLRAAVRQGSFDLVHAHYGLTGALALSQRSLPVVTTFHGSDTGYVPWQARISRFVARRTTPVFVSRHGADQLGLPDAPIIPVGVDVERFRPVPRDEARRQLGWSADEPVALFPGSPENSRKRYDLFEAAVHEARRAVPTLTSVALTGYDRDAVSLVLNAVDVIVMTSDWEGSPLTVREGLACSTPVVSVPVGDVREALAGLPGCAVVERDAAALGAAVVEALRAGRPRELRGRAEESGRTPVAERIVELYGEVLEART